MKKKDIAIGAALLLVAVSLRVYRLQEESIWFDESVSARQLTPDVSLGDYLESVRKLDPTVDPLYFSLLLAWSKMFGCSAWACRSLSIALGSISIVFVYLAGLEFFKRRLEASISALLACVTVQYIYYSQEIRMYPLYMFLASLSIYGIIRFFNKNDRLWIGLNIGANMLLVWTHLLSPLLMVTEGFVMIWHCRRAPRNLVKWVAPQMLNIAIWWFLWGRTIRFDRIDGASAWKWNLQWGLTELWQAWVTNLSHAEVHVLAGPVAWIAMVFAVSGMCLIGYGWFVKKTIASDQLLVVLIAATPIIMFAFSKWVFPFWLVRYTIYAPIGTFLLSAVGTRLVPRLQYPFACILLVPFFIQFPLLHRPLRPDWQSAVPVINDGRPVVLIPAYERQTLKNLLKGRTVGLGIRDLERKWGCWPPCDRPGGDCCIQYEECVDRQLQEVGGWMVISVPELVVPGKARMEELGYSFEYFQSFSNSFRDISIWTLRRKEPVRQRARSQ